MPKTAEQWEALIPRTHLRLGERAAPLTPLLEEKVVLSHPLAFTAACYTYLDSPGGSDGKGSACNAGDSGSIPWVRKILLEKRMATHSSILA